MMLTGQYYVEKWYKPVYIMFMANRNDVYKGYETVRSKILINAFKEQVIKELRHFLKA